MGMSNSTAILAALNTPAFDVVRDKIRANMLDWAKRLLAITQKEVAAWVPSERLPVHVRSMDDYKSFPASRIRHAWVNKNKEAAPATPTYQNQDLRFRNLQKEIAGWTLDEAAIEKAADQQWEDNKAFFAARVGEKADLIGGDGEVTLNVSLDSELVGYCTVVLGDKKLVLRTSLKTNYRYGENAADGQMTVYRQVPTLVESAEGFDVVARQAEIDRAVAQAKVDRKTHLETLQTEIEALERRKRCWDDLYGTLSYCAKYNGGVLANGNLESVQKNWAKLGNNPEVQFLPTLASAKVMVKETRQAVKDAKEKLKLAKAAK
jgi:hypothetical protein